MFRKQFTTEKAFSIVIGVFCALFIISIFVKEPAVTGVASAKSEDDGGSEDKEDDAEHEDKEDDSEREDKEDKEDDEDETSEHSSAEDVVEYEEVEVEVPVLVEQPIVTTPVVTVQDVATAVGATENAGPQEERVTNEDGTWIDRVTTMQDGTITIAEDFFAADGARMRHSAFVRTAEGEETAVVTYFDANGEPIENPLVETTDGKFVQVVDYTLSADKKTRFFHDQNTLFVKHPSGTDVAISALDKKFVIAADGVSARTALAVIADDQTGDLYLEGFGERQQFAVLPQNVPQIVSRNNLGERVDKIDVIEDDDGHIVYFGEATKTEYLLGFYAVTLKTHVAVDVTTGNVVDTKRGLWTSILAALSW